MRSDTPGATPSSEKILLLLPEFQEGGVENHVLELAEGLSSLGHRVWIASSGGSIVNKLPPSIPHITLPVHKKNLFVGLSCAHKLARLIKREKISFIHAHSRVPGWICCFVKMMTRVTYLFTAHSRYSLKPQSIWPIAHADGIICVSDTVKKHLQAHVSPKKPLQVIYNPRPDRVVKWQGSSDAIPHILYLGRLTPKKGASLLIEAMAALAEHAWKLDFVGDGPLAPVLRQRAAELDLQDRVAFHGHQEDAASWISRCDLFVFPSFDEGMGMALVEALMAEAPVISTDLPAVREITNARGLVPPEDARALGQAIAVFLDDRNSLPALRLTATLPSTKEMAEQVVNFYRSVL